MLIHGVAFTAELNWGKVFAPLSRLPVIAVDLRGHGDGIKVGSRFRLEDCADDIAALAEVLGISSFIAVGYSMGRMVAQLLYKRHASLLSAWSCAPPRATSWDHRSRRWPPWCCQRRPPPCCGYRCCSR